MHVGVRPAWTLKPALLHAARRCRGRTLRAAASVDASDGATDRRFMRVALDEARLAGAKGEVPVGAVLVAEGGRMIARAHNCVETSNDPTAHAELLCLREAAEKVSNWRLLGVRGAGWARTKSAANVHGTNADPTPNHESRTTRPRST